MLYFFATATCLSKTIAVLVVAAFCYYIVYKFINKLREWKRRYLLTEALPSPNTKNKNVWLSHLSDIIACRNVKEGKNDLNKKQQNVWPLIESWCKEMCYKKGHGGFQINILSPSRLPFASKTIFWAIDYELVKKVVNHPDLRTKGSTYDNSKSLIDHSVLIATGHDWKRMRNLTAKAFSNTVMKITHNASIRILHYKVLSYFDHKQSNTDKPYVDLVELLNRFTLDVLGIASFSYEFGGIDEFVSSETTMCRCDSIYKEQQQQQELYQRRCAYENKKPVHQIFSEITQDITILDRYRGLYKPKRMGKNVRDLNNVINTVVDAKMQQQQRNINNNKNNIKSDLLDYLLERNPNDGTSILTREEIIGNTKVFSFAGQESTSTTLSAMFYELGRSPDIVEKLRQEIDPYFDDQNGSGCGPSYNDLRGNCNYVNKVVREILRLHPPALFSRVSATKEVFLKTSKFQYILPKNTEIFLSPWLSQRHYFNSSNINNNNNKNGTDDNSKEGEEEGKKSRCEQPYDVFDPDRTIDKNDPFFPFAIGARNCVGREMAMAEIRVVLAQVVHNYDLIIEPEDKINGMEIYVVLTLRVGNYGMKFVKRKNKEEKKFR